MNGHQIFRDSGSASLEHERDGPVLMCAAVQNCTRFNVQVVGLASLLKKIPQGS